MTLATDLDEDEIVFSGSVTDKAQILDIYLVLRDGSKFLGRDFSYWRARLAKNPTIKDSEYLGR